MRFILFLVGLACAAKPTLNPTKKPTTQSPTKKPTSNPTSNPTLNPTPQPTFQAKKQLRRWVLKTGDQITSDVAGYSKLTYTPIEMLVEGTLYPVHWTNVQWTLFGATQTPIPECNPVPTPLPGELVLDLYGVPICPSLIDCTSSSGPPFSSLRACITSKTVEIVGPGVLFNRRGLLAEGILSGPADVKVPQPQILCNNAVDREINCQLSRQSVNYQLQCQSEPITCWQNETIGHFFGLLENQNPKFPYPTNQSLWSDSLYLGIASILNNYTYFKDGKKWDPLNTENLNSYYWIQAYNLTTQSVSSPILISPDVLQLEPLNWFGAVEGGLGYEQCFTNLQSGSQVGCQYLTASNSSYLQKPGLWIFPQFTGYPYWFNFTITSFSVESAELYLNNTRIWVGVADIDGLFTLPAAGKPGTYSIRLLSVQSIWDIPSAQWTREEQFYPDSLWSSVNLGPFQKSPYQLVTGNGVFLNTIGLEETNWPHITVGSPDTSIEILISSQENPQTWQPIADLIYNQNIYPPNPTLVNFTDRRPTDLSLDKDYLYEIWANNFARRHMSEDVDCQTLELGKIVNRPEGINGGCVCDPFWDSSLGCAQCLPGLGGDNCSLPYQPWFPGEPPFLFPNTQTFSSQVIEILEIGGKGPLCQQLLFNNTYFTLTVQGETSLIYQQGATYFLLLEETIYLNQTLLPFLEIQSLPFSPVWQTPLGQVECISPLTTSLFVWLDPTRPIRARGWWWS